MANDMQGQFGSATREVTNDPLSPKLGIFDAPRQIAGGGAGGVASQDTSHLGDSQRAISKLLGDGSNILDSYLEKKKDQWELDGKMAYAQGKTEDEIRATGNQYSLGGFMSMNVQTSANSFYQDSLDKIDQQDKTIDPSQYRAQLGKAYSDLSSSVSSSNDPFVKQLLANSASETMPKLVEAQTKAHNTWKENETFNGYTNLLYSEATKTDPTSPTNGDSLDHLRELLHPEVSTLSPERHRDAVTAALKRSLESGDNRLQQAIAGTDLQQANMNASTNGIANAAGIQSKDLPPATQIKAQAMNFVSQVEGGFVPDDAGHGPTLYGINSQANPTEYNQIKAAYDAKDIEGAKAMAKDTYSKKYWDAIGADKLPADTAIIAFDGAVNQGPEFMKQALAQAGDDPKKLIDLRRQKYIQIAQDDPTKAKYLSGWMERLNKLDTNTNSATPLATTVQGMTTEASMIKNLTANGYSSAQIETAVSASRAAATKKSTEFDKTRILTEQSIEDTAKTDGNLPARLDDIARVKQQNNYSDEWAQKMATRAQSAVEANVKERDAKVLRTNAMNSPSLYQALPADQQSKAIEEHRNQTIQTVAANTALTDDQKNEQIRAAHGKFLIERNAVDPVWQNQMQSSLSGKIIDDKGQLKPAALNAYKDYVWLSQNGTPGLANKFVTDPQAQALITRAESYDSGGMNSEAALMTSAQIAQRSADSGTPDVPALNPKDLDDVVNKSVNNMTPEFFSTFGKSDAQNYSDVPDWQIDSAKSDPMFRAMLKAETLRVLTMTPDLAKTPAIAVTQAMKNLQPRMEMVQGNILFSPSGGTSIRQDMGITDTTGNVVGAAMDEFMRKQGKNLFGPQFDESQIFGKNDDGTAKGIGLPFNWGTIPLPSVDAISDTIRNQYKGIPPYHAEYDPVTKSVKIDLYQDYTKKLMVNNPKFIPAEHIGAVYNIVKREKDTANSIRLDKFQGPANDANSVLNTNGI